MTGAQLEEAVRSALGDVHDPCSVNAGAPMSIIDMGLMTSLRASETGEVTIALRATTPMCTLLGSILRATEDRVRRVGGVSSVSMIVDTDTSWSEDAMTGAGRAVLAASRQRPRRAVPVARQEWRTRLIGG